jgi:hypothetical protein
MDKRTTGIIVTVVAVLLCGCPGLISLCMGSMFALVGFIPGSDIDIGGSSDPQSAILTGVGMVCAGIIFIAIPAVVGFFMLRRKPEAVSNEPLPPGL